MAAGISSSECAEGWTGLTVYHGGIRILHVGISNRLCLSVCQGMAGRCDGHMVGNVH